MYVTFTQTFVAPQEDEFDALQRKRLEEDLDVDVETVEPIGVGKDIEKTQPLGQDDDDYWIDTEPDNDTVLDYTPVLDVLEAESDDDDET